MCFYLANPAINVVVINNMFISRKKNNHFKFFAFTLLLSQSPGLYGQDMEEVEIIAEQTGTESLDDLVSVSALDAEKLADAGIENVEDVAAYVPNLVLSETATGTNIVIRGIGAGVNQGFDQSVGLYVDKVPLPRGQMARAPFLDLDGIQVLRGPQYVKDGNYSLAGSVHMLTKGSTEDFEAGISLDYVPSQNDQTILLTTSLPLGDYAGFRFAVQSQTSDGYIENVTRDEGGPQSDELLVRTVFSFNPTENLSLKFKAEKGRFDTVGRQIEILESQPTPNYLEFAEVIDQIANGSVSDVGSGVGLENVRVPLPNINDRVKTAVLPVFVNEVDYYLEPYGTFWNVAYEDTNLRLSDGRDVPFSFGNRNAPTAYYPNSSDPNAELLIKPQAFAGRSYLQVLHDMYTGNEPVSGVNIAALGGFVPFNNVGYTPPVGLLDSELNFQRAADAEEFSNNDSSNYTLNTELWMGEHRVELTASYIDYEVDEQIDSDFTAVPILVTNQSEEYDQQFFRLDYTSPEGRFLELSAGASFLKSSLSFNQTFRGQINPAGEEVVDQATAEAYVLRELDNVGTSQIRLTDLTFDPEYPFTNYFGRVQRQINSPFRLYSPNRTFDQVNEVTAGFLEGKINWSDTFRTVLGLRYTRSEKQAVRDFAFLLPDGNAYTIENPAGGGDARQGVEQRATEFFGFVFNFEEHTDRIPASTNQDLPEPALRGDRAEESLLPSLTLEWDVTEDLSLNASVRMANKLGGFDALSVSRPVNPPTGSIPEGGTGIQPGTFEFEDEDATTYEVGARWFLPDGYGEFHATAFYTNFKNLQVSAADRAVGFNVQNAGAARTFGVEVEGNLLLTDRFTINYSAAWIDFEFTDYQFATCPYGRRPDFVQVADQLLVTPNGGLPTGLQLGELRPVIYDSRADANLPFSLTGNQWLDYGYGTVGSQATTTINPGDDLPSYHPFQFYNFNNNRLPYFCDFNGETNQYVAEWQGTFTFNYDVPLTSSGMLKSTLDVLYNSGYYTTVTLDEDVAQDEYFQFNGRIALASDDETWEVALTAENITNEKIVLFASEVPIATRLQSSKSHYGFVRSPRALGLSFTANFY